MEDQKTEMIGVLKEFGARFHSDDVEYMAEEWLDEGFSPDEAREWMEAGFWEPSVARGVRDADVSADEAAAAAKRLVDAEDPDVVYDRGSKYTDGDPIYAVCNRDADVEEIINEAKAARD